ncbi:MAG: NADH-quinone oxidoreductase subunit J [Anaerolineae bacterium]|nr:NADH-quinone oxidoreductase subunit J [Anaerolineae bacterium]
MNIVFYISSAVAIAATVMVITRLNAVHALLYMIVSLLAMALVFFTLGAPFVAALEVIVYAGAIMVLFVFVIMMLNLGEQATDQERQWLHGVSWLGPAGLAGLLLVLLVYILFGSSSEPVGTEVISPQQVGLALFGPYLLAVELAAFLLLAGMVGAYHLGRRAELMGKRVDVAQGGAMGPDQTRVGTPSPSRTLQIGNPWSPGDGQQRETLPTSPAYSRDAAPKAVPAEGRVGKE